MAQNFNGENIDKFDEFSTTHTATAASYVPYY